MVPLLSPEKGLRFQISHTKLSLALGKRRGELHALTRDGLSWNHDKTIVYCGFDPLFISKTQPRTGIPMTPFVVNALSVIVGSADPEELVCVL